MASDPKKTEELIKKWEPVLEGELMPIKDAYRRKTTAIVLGPTDVSGVDFTKHTMEEVMEDFQKSFAVYDASSGEIKLAPATELETYGGPRGEPRGTEVETLCSPEQSGLYANGRQTTNQEEALERASYLDMKYGYEVLPERIIEPSLPAPEIEAMIAKAQDRLEAYDTIGVSPMAGPSGLLSAAQKEALESGYAEAAPVVWYDDPPTGGEGCCCSPKHRAPVKDYRWAIVVIAAIYIMGVVLTFA
jgi:hypothetical protein